MRRTKGFTLVELLVVISIISILATLLVPAVQRAVELANQASCRANLKGVGTAIAMFKGEDQNSKFPLVWEAGQPESPISKDDAKETMELLKSSNTGNASAMQNVWKIVEKGLVTEDAFGCASDDEYESRVFKNKTDRRDRKYGWLTSKNFSYGLHFPYRTLTAPGDQQGDDDVQIDNPAYLRAQLKGSFVIMADKNPTRIGGQAVPVSSKQPAKYPSNHMTDGEGYLMFSGAVNWKRGADNSDVNGDDIYTIETDFASGESNANGETPANLDDQYITLHPIPVDQETEDPTVPGTEQ